MPHELKFNHPHFPEGTVFSIAGLGEIENGGTLGLDEDAERFFVSTVGDSVENAFANSATVEVSGSSELKKNEVEELTANRGTAEELGRTGLSNTEAEGEGQPTVQEVDEPVAPVVPPQVDTTDNQGGDT